MHSAGELSLTELNLVCELAQQTSLRSLGRAKGFEPSHISKMLRRIERKWGAPIVARSVKGIVLTPDGLRLVAVAKDILDKASPLLDSPPPGAEPHRKELLTLAAPRFVCQSVLAPLVEHLSAQQSRFRFRILDMAPDQLTTAAFKAACEAVVSIGRPALSSAWNIRPLGDLSWGLFANGRHPLKERTTESLVLRYPFIVPNYWNGKEFEIGHDQCPIPWRKRLLGDETSAISTAIEILKNSETQLIFAPKIVAENSVRDGTLKELNVKGWPEVKRPLYLAVRSDRVSRLMERALLELIGAMLE